MGRSATNLWPLGDSLEEVEYKLKSKKRLDRVEWTAEYDGIMNKTLRGMSKCIRAIMQFFFYYDYDSEMFKKYKNC